MSIWKKIFSSLFLNISLVVLINSIAFFWWDKFNINYFLYLLIFLVYAWFFFILSELFYYFYKEINKKNYYLLIFLLALTLFFILNIKITGQYYYYRLENYNFFEEIFWKYDFNTMIINKLSDFTYLNLSLLISPIRGILPEKWVTIYHIYLFFQFIGWIYLYRIFSLFSKEKIFTIIYVFLYFWIEFFWLLNHTLTYVNIIVNSFIIFLFYLFCLEKEKNNKNFYLYIFAYIFLITWRPDFFFLSLIIELLNAYFRSNNIISLKNNFIFYILLIPYYFIINRYLLIDVNTNVSLIWHSSDTNNFWYIIVNKVFWDWILDKFFININFLFNDKLFTIMLFILTILLIYVLMIKKLKNIFSIVYLIMYALFYFFVVTYVHEEGFVNSSLKYLSLIYLIIYLVIWLLIIKVYKKFGDKIFVKIWIYTILFLFIWFNYYGTIINYCKFNNILYNWETDWVFIKKFKGKHNIDDINVIDRIYEILYRENILYYRNYIVSKLDNDCKKILVWNFKHEYNQLYSEFRILPSKYLSYFDFYNKKCLVLLTVFEDSNKLNYVKLDDNIQKYIDSNYKEVKNYNRFIEKWLWIDISIMKNINAK